MIVEVARINNSQDSSLNLGYSNCGFDLEEADTEITSWNSTNSNIGGWLDIKRTTVLLEFSFTTDFTYYYISGNVAKGGFCRQARIHKVSG
jgi:hypothetical protein